MRQMHLEEYLRRALTKEAEKIAFAPDLARKIKAEIQKEKGGILVFGTKLIDRLLPGQPGWKKAVAGTLCSALLVGGLTFGVSPQARAWAEDLVISPVISIVYKVTRTEDGYSVVKLRPEEVSESGAVKFEKGPADPAKIDPLLKNLRKG